MPENIPPIRTFEADIADSMREKQASILHIALAEQERAREKVVSSNTSRTSFFVYIMSAFFILIAIGVIGYLLVHPTEKVVTVLPIAENTEALLQTDSQVRVLFDSNKKKETLLLLSATSSVSTILGVTTRIVPYIEENGSDGTKIARALSSDIFLATLFPNSPDVLRRSVRPDFMYIKIGNTSLESALIFEASDYERTVVGMNSWQRNMVDDIGTLFNTTRTLEFTEEYEVTEDVPVATSTLVSTSTNKNRTVPIVQSIATTTRITRLETRIKKVTDSVAFESSIRKNIEIKTAQGGSGKTYLVYGFPTRNVLVIAQSLDTFLQIAERLKLNQ